VHRVRGRYASVATLIGDFQRALGAVDVEVVDIVSGSAAPVDGKQRALTRVTARISITAAHTGHTSESEVALTPEAVRRRLLSLVSGAPRRMDSASASDSTLLLASYDSASVQLGDFDSTLLQGQVTSSMDGAFTPLATDDSGESALTQPAAPRDCYQVDCASKAATPDSGNGGGGATPSGPSAPATAGGASTSQSVPQQILASPLYLGLCIAGSILLLAAIIGGVVYCVRAKNARAGSYSDPAFRQLVEANELLAPAEPTGRWI
jgi:hypothetical protein